jgi:oxygen-independent coproporphyrinogen-3 oxidase
MGYLQRFSYSNLEDINEYVATVNAGKLPISRLSESTPEDMMRRVMTRLYLRLPVSKQEFMEKFGKLPEEVFPQQLRRLKEKGLIEINEKEIRITKLGDVWKGNIAWEFAPKTSNRVVRKFKQSGATHSK